MTLAYPSDTRVVGIIRFVGRFLFLVLLCRSTLVLLGWIMDIEFLKTLLSPGANTRFLPPLLNFLTALSLYILSRSDRLFSQSDRSKFLYRWVPILSGAIVSAVAVLTLAEYLMGLNFGIDELFFTDQLRGMVEPLPGRMSPNAAIGFLFLGVAILLLSLRNKRVRSAQALSLGACAIAMLALMGHAYGVNHLYSFTGLASMTFFGAIWFLLLSVSAFIVLPESGMMQLLTSTLAGGVIARRLFLAILLIPPLLGGLSLDGYNALFYDTQFSIALLVIFSMIVFGGITAMLSIRLDSADRRKREAEQQLSHSREELRDLSAHVQARQEEERIRIAREIHDELGQALTAIKMDVSLLRRAAEEKNTGSSERLEGILGLVNATIRTVQRIATELRPGVLDDLGLTAALEWQTQEFQLRTGIATTLTVRPPEVTADQTRSTALFRIFQETLTNVARHAHARHVAIILEKADHSIRLRISDDGLGIDSRSLTRGESLGLIGMRERAHLLGGTIEIIGVPNGGTTVEVRLPLDAEFVEQPIPEHENV